MARHIHTVDPGCVPSLDDIQNAVSSFWTSQHIRPKAIMMPYKGLMDFQKTFYGVSALQSLERGKEYGTFITTPFGPIEITVLPEDDMSMSGNSNIIVVENNMIDEAFEEEVLGVKPEENKVESLVHRRPTSKDN